MKIKKKWFGWPKNGGLTALLFFIQTLTLQGQKLKVEGVHVEKNCFPLANYMVCSYLSNVQNRRIFVPDEITYKIVGAFENSILYLLPI